MLQSERDRLIEKHLSPVRHLAKVMAARAMGDAEEFESEGYLALTEAAGRYDASRGIPFWRYVRRRIFGAMLDLLRREQTRRRVHEEARTAVGGTRLDRLRWEQTRRRLHETIRRRRLSEMTDGAGTMSGSRA